MDGEEDEEQQAEDHDVGILDQQRQQQEDTGEVGEESGDQLGFGLGQIEGLPVGLGQQAEEDDDEESEGGADRAIAQQPGCRRGGRGRRGGRIERRSAGERERDSRGRRREMGDWQIDVHVEDDAVEEQGEMEGTVDGDEEDDAAAQDQLEGEEDGDGPDGAEDSELARGGEGGQDHEQFHDRVQDEEEDEGQSNIQVQEGMEEGEEEETGEGEGGGQRGQQGDSGGFGILDSGDEQGEGVDEWSCQSMATNARGSGSSLGEGHEEFIHQDGHGEDSHEK